MSDIICECPLCFCPYVRKYRGKYSFSYIREDLSAIYFNVPKAASSLILQNIFQKDLSHSLRIPNKPDNEYLKFSFVRNPWDRMVSNWKMFTQKPNRRKQLRSMFGKENYSFEEFIEKSQKLSNHHWLPQSIFVPTDIDFIGKIENLEKDMRDLYNILGMKYNSSDWNYKKNSTVRKKEYQYYYNDFLAEKVSRIYFQDIERFKYSY